MLARRKKTRPWLKGKHEALTLLAQIAQSFETHDSLEERFQQLGEQISKYTHAEGHAIYRYNRRKKCFSLHVSYGNNEAFKQQQDFSFQDIQDCGAQLTEFATLSSTLTSPNAGAQPPFLQACAERAIQSLAYIPIVAHASLHSLLWLVSKQVHHNSEEDRQFFSVLMQHLRLSEEKALLVEQFEQDVAKKVSQLQESEEKYRVLFEDASDAIMIVDFESQHFLEANRQTEYLLGYSKDELLAMPISDFWAQKDKKHFVHNLLISVEKRKSIKFQERQIYRKDGSSLWVEINASAVEYRGKKVALAIMRDVSQRKQVELEKEAIEAVNNALLSIHDVYDMYSTMSETLLNVFHFDRMDILLRGAQAHTARLFISIQHRKRRSTQDEREFSFHKTPIGEVFHTGTPEIVSYHLEQEAPRPSGFFDKQLKTSLFFPLGFKKHVSGILHFGSYEQESFSPKHFDFLQRISMQIAVTIDNMLLFHTVNEERAVYKHLIENVNEIVFQADPKGTILFVNHRVKNILGYTSKEITGTSFFACVIPEDLEEAKAAFRLTLRHERPLSGEFRVLHKNGKVLTISIYTRPIFEDGRSVGMQGIIQDMTPASNHFTPHRNGLHELIGRSRKMQEIYVLITSVAKTDSTVLIHGESGTGKELIAQAVHASSHRHNKPFIVVNCAAYSEHLLESELFGHERGAFTGAHRRKLGRFELAKGGTIFLDEIGEIPLHSQVLLLRVLQNKSFERVGGEKTQETDVRIVAATNKNLEQEIKAGRFREDLYYRLNVIPIEVPPLQERKEDIPHLVDHFRKKYSTTTGKQVLNCSQSALEVLMRYNWYGNVRELENTIERAVVMASGPVITPADLPPKLRQEIDIAVEDSAALAEIQPKTLYEHEKHLISKTLQAVKWNKYQAAKLLGITRSTLYSKIQRYKLETDQR